MVDNVIVWVSIPVQDIERATKFYAHVTGREVPIYPEMDNQVAAIQGPAGEYVVSADLNVQGKAGTGGPIPYLGSRGDIRGMVERVREAGGTVVQEPQYMGELVGTIAFFDDSEGNRIGIQQPGEA